ncbi:MAG: GumC family protein [Syntrophomonadaceae bacterium]|jgi:succinoglycan biosynthesis transport protein ExoP
MTEPNSYNYPVEDEMEIDLRQIFKVLKKWRRLIVAMTLLCTFTAGIISFFVLPPIYQAQTLLMVNQATDKLQTAPVQQGDDLENVVGTVSNLPVLTMSTYLGQMQSEVLMSRIISRLGLSRDEYTPASLAGMINAEVVKDSNLIQVKVTNADPVLAAKIANTLTSEYLQLMTDKNQEQMNRSGSFLNKQEKATNKDLAEAQEKLKQLQSQPRGVAVLEAEFNKKSEDLVNFQSQLKTAQVEVQQLNSGVNSLEKELAATPKMIDVEKYNETDGSTTRTQESNPLYVALAQQLAEKKSALAEKQAASGGLQVLVGSLSQELDALQAELAQKKMQQDDLQRQVDRLKETSNTLAKKGTEAQIAKSIDLGDTRVMVVSEASVPTDPVKPNKKLNIAIAFVLGLMLFTLLAFLLEYLDNTLKTAEDVTNELELPVLGLIPKANKRNVQQNSYGG